MKAFFKNGLARWALLPIALIGAIVWFVIYLEFPTCTFRYKLTAEVMTPDGLKTGSSVVDVTYDHSGDYGGGHQPYLKMVGDAGDVDLGMNRHAFVTFSTAGVGNDFGQSAGLAGYIGGHLGRMNIYALPLFVFGLKWKFGSEDQLCKDYAALGIGKKAEVPFANLPTIVTFDDIHNPDTVKAIKPEGFDAAFGEGYKLKRVILETTAEPITQNIDHVLDWLPKKNGLWASSHKTVGPIDSLMFGLGYDAFRGPGLFQNGAEL